MKLALPKYCTVYQAELLAINRSTRYIIKHNARSFGIFSDSMAAIQTVKNPSSLHPLAVEARDNLKKISSQDKDVTLFWIKAHAGLEGNERADQLAKEAAQKLKKRPDYDLCPVSFVRRSIRLDTLERWNNRYQTEKTASITKLFFPSATDAYRIVRKMKLGSLTTQIMTGHGGFSEYLNRFKCKESPSCACDPHVLETVPHILFDCPVYALERLDVEFKLNVEMKSENAKDLMMGKNRSLFMSFCKQIAQMVVNKNKTR
ncbi:hypothetical protein O0L34_g4679 [Tuta absoluta]|nr:hypothetical protein O0L34_g4679 [Tuta absoluta]